LTVQLETPLPYRTLLRPVTGGARWLAGALTLLAAAWAASQIGLGARPLLNPGGWVLWAQFWGAALHPALDPAFLTLALAEAVTTLAYAVGGTFLSLLIGLAGGVLASEVWWQAFWPAHARRTWLTVRAVLAGPRAIHEVIWGLLLINILGLNPWAAVLSIAIPFGAVTAKVFAEILDETPRGVWRALLSGGSSPLAALGYSLLPQALPNLLAYAFYRFECSIRSAAVLGLIGAGGLGYQLLLSFQSLRYAEMWTLLWALMALSGVVDLWSGRVRRSLRAASCVGAPSISSAASAPGRALTRAMLAGLALVPLAFLYLRLDPAALFAPRALMQFIRLGRALWPPALEPTLLAELFSQTAQTLAISILALMLAASGGLALSFFAARNLTLGWMDGSRPPRWQRWLGWGVLALTRGLLLLLRAVPASVWALILLFVFFPGILPGALALGLYTLGILGRLMAEVIEELDERPLRALSALGASGPQVFAYGIFPRALPNLVSYGLYRWEVCVRETVMVGVVGAAGLGRAIAEHLSNFDYAALTTTLLAFAVLTFLVDMVSAATRQALR
jgi:phosphonate transport system permease protein